MLALSAPKPVAVPLVAFVISQGTPSTSTSPVPRRTPPPGSQVEPDALTQLLCLQPYLPQISDLRQRLPQEEGGGDLVWSCPARSPPCNSRQLRAVLNPGVA